jgi:hypothetical protein
METTQSIFWQILPLILEIAIPILLVLIGIAVRKLTKNLDAGYREKIEGLINDAVAQGVGYAEQIAAQKAKENEEIHGEEKQYIAIEYIINELRKRGITDAVTEDLRNRIEAYLGSVKVLSPGDEILFPLLPPLMPGDDELGDMDFPGEDEQ